MTRHLLAATPTPPPQSPIEKVPSRWCSHCFSKSVDQSWALILQQQLNLFADIVSSTVQPPAARLFVFCFFRHWHKKLANENIYGPLGTLCGESEGYLAFVKHVCIFFDPLQFRVSLLKSQPKFMQITSIFCFAPLEHVEVHCFWGHGL